MISYIIKGKEKDKIAFDPKNVDAVFYSDNKTSILFKSGEILTTKDISFEIIINYVNKRP